MSDLNTPQSPCEMEGTAQLKLRITSALSFTHITQSLHSYQFLKTSRIELMNMQDIELDSDGEGE